MKKMNSIESKNYWNLEERMRSQYETEREKGWGGEREFGSSRFMKNRDIQKILTSIKFLFLLSLLSLSSKVEICDKLPVHTPNSLNSVSLNKHWETWHMI